MIKKPMTSLGIDMARLIPGAFLRRLTRTWIRSLGKHFNFVKGIICVSPNKECFYTNSLQETRSITLKGFTELDCENAKKDPWRIGREQRNV